MKIKNGDFVELDFTGKIVETDKVFDTTLAEVAQKNNIFQAGAKYEPIRLVVGETHVVPGLDLSLVDKSVGKFKVTLNPEEGFGRKHSKLLKIIPMRDFKKQNVKPFVGLEVQIDGMPGIVRTVSGGRTIVDFNHPLAGKDLEYDIDVKKILTSDKEKAESIMKLMQIPYDSLEIKEKKAIIQVPIQVPEQLNDHVQKEMKRLANLKVEFKEKTKETKKPKSKGKQETSKEKSL